MMSNLKLISLIIMAVLVLSGCMRDMQDQPRYEPLEASDFFENGSSARHLPEGTIARGMLKEDKHLYEGLVNGKQAKDFPIPITHQLVKRGQERFQIFCSVCHGATGDATGMVVRRGFPAPPSYHTDRLREATPGYLFNVITNGLGKMSGYADQVEAKDRWAIIAYIRALQLSQNASVKDVPSGHKKDLNKTPEEQLHKEEESQGHH